MHSPPLPEVNFHPALRQMSPMIFHCWPNLCTHSVHIYWVHIFVICPARSWYVLIVVVVCFCCYCFSMTAKFVPLVAEKHLFGCGLAGVEHSWFCMLCCSYKFPVVRLRRGEYKWQKGTVHYLHIKYLRCLAWSSMALSHDSEYNFWQ